MKGFVKCFLKVPLACLGSMAAAVHCTAQPPVELSENILQNLLNKLPPQTVLRLHEFRFSVRPLVLGSRNLFFLTCRLRYLTKCPFWPKQVILAF